MAYPRNTRLVQHSKITITHYINSLKKYQLSSVAQSCLTLCNPMNCSMPDLPVNHQHPEFTQIHVH